MQINEQGKEPRRLLWVFSSYYYYNYLLYGQSLSAFVSLLACVFINKAWAEWRPRPRHCSQAGGGHFRGHLFHSLETFAFVCHRSGANGIYSLPILFHIYKELVAIHGQSPAFFDGLKDTEMLWFYHERWCG